ncbi:hypothetical protein VT03_31795 [Planctomyces sp. SH-PL14]|nr:hypothetical protein VT03_31795 [Planctomyces sp. SH-PL14]
MQSADGARQLMITRPVTITTAIRTTITAATAIAATASRQGEPNACSKLTSP